MEHKIGVKHLKSAVMEAILRKSKAFRDFAKMAKSLESLGVDSSDPF